MDRRVERVHDDPVRSGRVDLGEVLGHRPAGDGHHVAVQQSGVEQHLEHHRYATDLVEVAHVELAARLHVGDVRDAIGDPVEVVEVEVDPGLVGERQQVQHGVGRTTEGGGDGDRVLERLLGHDLTWRDTESEQVDHCGAGTLGVTFAATADGRRRRGARQAHADRFGDRAHRVGGEHAAARPFARARLRLDRVQFGVVDGAGSMGAHRFEHAGDVERGAVVLTRHRRTVVDEHARQIESGSGEQHAGDRLVATRDARIPSWPIEIPSLTVIVPNSIGKPPASRTPALACSASLRSVMLHGVTSFHDEAMPTWGLSQSSSPIPTARSIARDGAFCMPSVTSRDRGFTSTGVPGVFAVFAASLIWCTVVPARGAEPGAVRTTRCQTVPMAEVRETKLPGVGVRHEFTTEDGDDIGVLVHHDGRRQILVYDSDDPDRCSSIVNLTAGDTRTVSELLGASRVTEAVTAVHEEIEGLAIEWIELMPESPASGATIGDGMYRTKTGSSIVAVIRDGQSIPAPGPEFPLVSGDVIVAVGTVEGLAAMRELIHP